MHVVITDQHGAVELSRELADDEVMDARQFAGKYADSLGVEIDDSEGDVFDGDITVQFRPDPDNAVHVWSSESFYFKAE